MVTSSMDSHATGFKAPRLATQPLELTRFREEAQRGIEMAAALAREGTEQARSLAQRVLAAIMLMLRSLLRVLERVLGEFKAGFGAGQSDARQVDPSASPEQGTLTQEQPGGPETQLQEGSVAQAVEDELPQEVSAPDEETASKARRVIELTAGWAADRLGEMTRAAAAGEFHVWSPAIGSAMKALAIDAPVLDAASRAMDQAHAELHAAAATVASRVGSEQQVPLFTEALAGIMRESTQDTPNGRHLLPKMLDQQGGFLIALNNYRQAAAAHRIVWDRVQSILEAAAPAESPERADLESAIHHAYPGLLQPVQSNGLSSLAIESPGRESPASVVAADKTSQSDSQESKLPAASNLLADDVPYERLADDEQIAGNVLSLESRPSPFAVLYRGMSNTQRDQSMAATG